MIFGGWQKFSAIDYPGKTSAILFTQGCPFRCPFCHNPELVDPERFITPVAEDEVMNFLHRRVGQLEAVVITGGEPTLQKDLRAFIRRVKDLGYLVKLDTNGNHPAELSRIIASGLVDYLAMDIKSPLAKYSEVAGQKIRPADIAKSVKTVMFSGVPYEFRTTVVKEQLSPEDILLIGQEISGAEQYILQKFSPQKTLNPMFSSATTYEDHEFDELIEKLKKNINRVFWR